MGYRPFLGYKAREPDLRGAVGEEGFRFFIFGDSKLEVGVESSNRRIFRRLIAESWRRGRILPWITGDVVAFPERSSPPFGQTGAVGATHGLLRRPRKPRHRSWG